MSNQPFRSLENYKKQQSEIAKQKGVYELLMAARTLTEARRVVYGQKKGHRG